MTVADRNAPAKPYTLAEYRELEATSEERHEYLNGAIRSMPGGTPNHSRLCRRIVAMLDMLLRESAYEPFDSNLRVYMSVPNQAAYPDAFVVKKPLQLNPDCDREAINPRLIVEVLSDSTEAYDRGKKFLYYRSIPTFCEYLLISQTEVFVTRYVKAIASEDSARKDGEGNGGDRWQLCTYVDREAIVPLESLGIEISLAELYGAVDFCSVS